MPAIPRPTAAAAALVVGLFAGACSPSSAAPAPTGSPPVVTIPPSEPPATPAPGVLRMFDIAPRPSGILAVDGLIWAEDHAATNKVYAIEPETGAIVAEISIGRPCDMAALDGRLWVADLDAWRVVWIDLETHTIGGSIGDQRNPCGVQAIDGAIWLAVDDGIARIDPETGKAVTTKLAGGAAFPAAGMPLWAASYRSGELLLIDPGSGDVTRTVAHPGGGAEGPPLALGFDSLWVGGAVNSVFRLDPATGEPAAEIPTSQPARLLATADGVWVTSYNGGTVERIDPATNKVVYRAHLNGSINGITEGPGGIWVADTSNGRLYLIDAGAIGIAP